MCSRHCGALTLGPFGPSVSASCLALAGTIDARFSLCSALTLPHPPSCLPSLGTVLLSALLPALCRCATMKALTAAPLTFGPALPDYFATPSCRSISNHVNCQIIAFHHASVTRVFRTSPWHRRLAAALRRIEFVILRTNSSPPVALHLASRRRSFLRLRSLWLPPTRTSTVLVWRPHGRTMPACAGMTDQ